MADSGYELERECHQMLHELGYFVLPGLRLFGTFSQKEKSRYGELADIDLYGVRFDRFLDKTCFIIDCKDGGSGLSNDVLNNAGLKKVIGASFLYMVRKMPVKAETKRLAELNGIKMVDKKFIGGSIKIKKPFGSFSAESYSRVAGLLAGNDSEGKRIVSEFLFPLEHKLTIADLYQRLVKSLMLFSRLKDEKVTAKNNDLFDYAVLISYQLLLLNMIEISGGLINCSGRNIRKEVLVGLNPEYDFKMKMVELLNRMGTKEGGETGSKVDISDISPTNTDEIVVSVKRIIRWAGNVQQLLRFNDYVIHQYLIHKKRPDFNEICKRFRMDKARLKALTGINKSVINTVTFKEKVPPILLNLT